MWIFRVFASSQWKVSLTSAGDGINRLTLQSCCTRIMPVKLPTGCPQVTRVYDRSSWRSGGDRVSSSMCWSRTPAESKAKGGIKMKIAGSAPKVLSFFGLTRRGRLTLLALLRKTTKKISPIGSHYRRARARTGGTYALFAVGMIATRAVAGVPEDIFEKHIPIYKDAKEELTTASVRLARGHDKDTSGAVTFDCRAN